MNAPTMVQHVLELTQPKTFRNRVDLEMYLSQHDPDLFGQLTHFSDVKADHVHHLLQEAGVYQSKVRTQRAPNRKISLRTVMLDHRNDITKVLLDNHISTEIESPISVVLTLVRTFDEPEAQSTSRQNLSVTLRHLIEANELMPYDSNTYQTDKDQHQQIAKKASQKKFHEFEIVHDIKSRQIANERQTGYALSKPEPS